MAQTTSAHHQAAKKMAQENSKQPRQKPGGGRKGTPRPGNVTDEEKRVIRDMYATGYTGIQIEQMTGIGHTTVYRVIGRTKGSTPTWTDDEIQIMVDGYLEKMPVKEIAKKLGKNEKSVRTRMSRYRKEVRNNPKKKRALGAITMAFKAVRKADIFREIEP